MRESDQGQPAAESSPVVGTAGSVAAPATSTGVTAPCGPLLARSLLGLSEDEIAALNAQAEILRSRRAQHAAPLPGISRSTVWRKLRRLERYGIAGLARKARADRGRARVADAKVIARIKATFLQTYRPSAASIYKDVAKDFEMSGLTPPSYSFVLRKTKEIDPDLIASARMGERNYDDKFCYITLRRKPALPRLWCDADHHQIDHYVIFDNGEIGRPWLTAIQDIATDECLGYRLTREARATYPGSAAIGLTLRHAILRKEDKSWPSFGLFDNFYCDLGKDFRAQYVREVCHDLNIKNVYARGYHGKSKPIERWFGVLEGSLKKLPGYCGKDPESNPERQRVGAPRSFEDMRGELMTIAQFEAALHNWIINEFHHAESRALRGLSPMAELERHIKNGWSAREVANLRALDLLLMRRAKKKVMRFGIAMFGTANVQRAFFAPELLDLINQEVEVFWDPAKIGELVVYGPSIRNRDGSYSGQSEFICVARNKELLDFGAEEEDVKAERELRRQQNKSRYDRLQQIQAEAQYPDPLARAQAQRRLEKVETEEREKIAVNARAPVVTALLPKFAGAAKKLREISGVRCQVSGPKPETRNLKPATDDLLSSAELFPEIEDVIDRYAELKSGEELFDEDN